jgi:hypothetical protein
MLNCRWYTTEAGLVVVEQEDHEEDRKKRRDRVVPSFSGGAA